MTITRTLLALALAAAGTQAGAAIVHSSDIVGNAIFGTGNSDGGWTINQTGNMELALRAKVRYDAAGDPQNIFNANGDGTFSHAVGNPGGALSGRARWNFEWSVNTDASGTGGAKLSAYNFVLGVDSDAGVGTSWHSYSLVGAPPTVGAPYSHSFGNNSTLEGEGAEAATPAEFATLLSSSSLMQNSSNMEFVDDGVLFGSNFDPNADGNYSFFLEARDLTGALIGRTEITVIVGAGATASVSAPASLALAGLGLLALGATRRRKA